MFKYIVISLIFLVALAALAVNHTNDLVNQYNSLSGAEKIFTKVYCASDLHDKTIEDQFDCFILDHL